MQMPPLASAWEPTRLTLQKYAHAMTALPRAGAPEDKRWSHVSLHPTSLGHGGTGFATAATPLADGTDLVTTLDIDHHQIVVTAGTDRIAMDLVPGPSPHSIGTAIADLASDHGSTFEVDAARYEDTEELAYEQWHAKAWHDNTVWVADTFAILNTGVEGETAGPHIWPHGFDVATEWFGTTVVGEGEAAANSQIAVGFYPAGDAYFYANPWPFTDSWAATPLPDGAIWHVDGWQGAMLPATNLDDSDEREQVLVFARAVHDLAHAALR